MTRVDFYILNTEGEQVRRQFACRLTEKVYRLGQRIHVVSADAAGVEALDTLLWTFRDGSFVPHATLAGAAGAPVTLGTAVDAPPQDTELVINLTDAALTAPAPRIAEIIDAGESARQRGRERFAAYRERGYTLETHEIG